MATPKRASEEVMLPRSREPGTTVLYGNRRQLMAEKNLHTLLHRTQQELKRMTESCRQFELAYHRSESKYANTLRQHIASLREEAAASSAVREVKPAGTQTEVPSVSDSDDIEEDGCPVTESPSTKFTRHEPHTGSKRHIHHPGEVDLLARCDSSDSGLVVSAVSVQGSVISGREERTNMVSGTDSTYSSVSSSSQRPQAVSTVTESPKAPVSLKKPSPSRTGSSYPLPLPPPGISRSLFDKLAHENVRLRTVLEDVLHNKGLSIESFLESSEYEDNIRELRSKIRHQNQEIETLKIQLQTGSGGLVEKCQELEQQVHKRNTALVGRQALLETLYNEYEKLKALLQKQQQGKDTETASLDTASKVHVETEVTTESPLQMQLKVYEDKLHESMKENSQIKQQLQAQREKCASLEKQLQQHSAGASELAKLLEEKQRLNAQVDDMKEHISLQEGQIKFFEEDFNTERKKKKVPTATLR